jgi:hypothetical protein
MKRGLLPTTRRQWSVLVGATVLLAIVVVATIVLGGTLGFEDTETATASEPTIESTEGTFSDEGYECRGFYRPYNVTEVRLSHAGGASLDLTRFDVTVAGNASAWGIEERDAYGTCGRESAAPAPDVRALSTNPPPVEFRPGQALSIVSHGGPSDENVEALSYGYDVSTYTGGVTPVDNDTCANPYVRIEQAGSGNKTNSTLVEQGDHVAVVWTAASGGASQRLFEHTVRQSVPDC